MITVVWGDIFKAQRDALVVPVNIIGTMGAGLAREVALRYPDAYRAYRAVCDSGELRIRTLALLDWMHPKLLLFPTKGHWREKFTGRQRLSSAIVTVTKSTTVCFQNSKPKDWSLPGARPAWRLEVPNCRFQAERPPSRRASIVLDHARHSFN